MTRTRTIWIAALALLALQACAETTPEISSGSNWLTCEALADCDDGRAVRCSADGYCLDADDERIAAAGPDASSGPAPSTAAGSPSEPSPVLDAGVALDGGQGTTVAARDASVQLIPPSPGAACDVVGGHDPLLPRADEICYEFAVHGASSGTDTSPFAVATGESYDQFYYPVPWPSGTVASSYGVVDDAGKSIQAWLFSTDSPTEPGTVSRNVSGTLLGENARMLAAWATGGCNVVLPDDVGLELPSSGNLVVQWHHLNDTGGPQDDTSDFRICTVPAASRPNLAGITILGNEGFSGVGLPPGESKASGSCPNDSAAHVTIVAFHPHMRSLGTRMTNVVERVDGSSETVFDAPFHFGDGESYLLDPTVVLVPGDVIRSTCTFDNTTGMNVGYGPSNQQEDCFQLAIAYPVGALDNGVLSLIGATNTCW